MHIVVIDACCTSIKGNILIGAPLFSKDTLTFNSNMDHRQKNYEKKCVKIKCNYNSPGKLQFCWQNVCRRIKLRESVLWDYRMDSHLDIHTFVVANVIKFAVNMAK